MHNVILTSDFSTGIGKSMINSRKEKLYDPLGVVRLNSYVECIAIIEFLIGNTIGSKSNMNYKQTTIFETVHYNHN